MQCKIEDRKCYYLHSRCVMFVFQKHFLDSRVPTLIVACKVEHPEVRQDYDLSPVHFCSKFKLPPPQRFTCIDKVNKDIYVKLATMAAYP